MYNMLKLRSRPLDLPENPPDRDPLMISDVTLETAPRVAIILQVRAAERINASYTGTRAKGERRKPVNAVNVVVHGYT